MNDDVCMHVHMDVCNFKETVIFQRKEYKIFCNLVILIKQIYVNSSLCDREFFFSAYSLHADILRQMMQKFDA